MKTRTTNVTPKLYRNISWKLRFHFIKHKIVDQNGLNVTPAALQDAQIRLKLSK